VEGQSIDETKDAGRAPSMAGAAAVVAGVGAGEARDGAEAAGNGLRNPTWRVATAGPLVRPDEWRLRCPERTEQDLEVKALGPAGAWDDAALRRRNRGTMPRPKPPRFKVMTSSPPGLPGKVADGEAAVALAGVEVEPEVPVADRGRGGVSPVAAASPPTEPAPGRRER
jgi:hypothetical protein